MIMYVYVYVYVRYIYIYIYIYVLRVANEVEFIRVQFDSAGANARWEFCMYYHMYVFICMNIHMNSCKI